MEWPATEPAFQTGPAPSSRASIAINSSAPAQSNRYCAGDETLQSRCAARPKLRPQETKTYRRAGLNCFAGSLDPRLAQEWDQQGGPFRPGSNEHGHLTVSGDNAPAGFLAHCDRNRWCLAVLRPNLIQDHREANAGLGQLL